VLAERNVALLAGVRGDRLVARTSCFALHNLRHAHRSSGVRHGRVHEDLGVLMSKTATAQMSTLPRMPMKVSEVIRLLEDDGWTLKRTSGSHRHYSHPTKAGLVTVAGKPGATLKPGTEASILKQAGLRKERS